MDALSETLRVVRLVGAIFIDARFSAPWCYYSPPADKVAPLLEPSADRVAIFHLVTEGSCWVEVDGSAPVRLEAGDVVLMTQGDAHLMASQPGLPPARGGASLEAVLSRRPGVLRHGGGGAPTKLVCGYLACDARLARLLLGGLPPLLRVSLRGSSSGAWLEASVRYALEEVRSPRAGGEGVLAKLAEVLFIEVLRLYMQQPGAGGHGWLAGVRDRTIGAVLAAMHRQPAHPWTLAELARHAGTSRSVLAERFQQLMDCTPMQYLTQWRMTLAANMLRHGNAPLVRIAAEVGYQTDTAFSRAFRREYGLPPATWRRNGPSTLSPHRDAGCCIVESGIPAGKPHSDRSRHMADIDKKNEHGLGKGAGAAAGAVTGGAIGSAVGPVGTAAGAVVGAVVGGVAGYAAGGAIAEAVNPTEYDDHFRNNYSSANYYSDRYTWNDYQPAYQYGYNTYGQYKGQRFEDVEPQLERDWNSARGQSAMAWNDAKGAVRDGWHYIERAVPGDADRDGR